MTYQELRAITKNREKRTLEYKESYNELPSSLFETVCAFLNRDGGVIVLGAHDDGTITDGVNPVKADQMCKNISNMSNNSEMLNPTFLLQPEIVEIDNRETLFDEPKVVIVIQIPSSSQVHTYRHITFDRSTDGDYQLRTGEQKNALYLRKTSIYTESTIYPYLKVEHFKEGIVDKAKNLIRNIRSDHPWLQLSEIDFFRQANLYRTDIQTGDEGFTLAALMLFGKDEIIQSALPYYKIDCIVRRTQTDRYDDRFTSFGNIIDGYTELMQFVEKHFPDTFYLEGDQRVSLRDKVFREVIVNMLIHREYQNPSISILDIRKNFILMQNANRPLRSGLITLDNYEPHPKNPHIANFFVQIGRAEHLGTGVRNLYRYAPLYFGEKPTIEDDNMFSVRFPISLQKQRELTPGVKGSSNMLSKNDIQKTIQKKLETRGIRLSKNQMAVAVVISQNASITRMEMGNQTGLSNISITSCILALKNKGILVRKGGRRYGEWALLL